MILVLLAAATLLFLHPFVLYPVLLLLLPTPRRPRPRLEEPLPAVAMVIPALNEAKVIGEKLENCYALDYPQGKLRIYLINDASTDATGEVARGFVPRGLRLIERTARRGKAANLNEVIPTLGEEIVLLSDANVIYNPQAVMHLVARFSDPTVGCVSGRVVLTDTTDEIHSSEELYYSLEWFLQHKASALYSMCGVDGAMHAFRRMLFRPVPDDTLVEDFVLGMDIARQGYRVVFEPMALAWERGPGSIGEEYRRKVRVAAGAAQAMMRGNAFPSGGPAVFWFVFVSHKLLRWLAPVTGLSMLVLAALVWPHWLAKAVLFGAAAVAALAAIRMVSGISAAVFNTPFYFLFGQAAMLRGLVKGAVGTQSVLWDKSNR